ncbi:helix-turn-helix domain-containing protein [Bradyrhizobium sp. McL0616]|uniref:helix-turn-helix domain-containing protein n=1 Tax=Bradyrhizobium sp. McL0616 TaxID=3415674 RepID=UPI003CEA57D3
MVETADAASVTEAAKRLNVSQPSISAALGQIEADWAFRSSCGIWQRASRYRRPASASSTMHDCYSIMRAILRKVHSLSAIRFMARSSLEAS